MMRKARQGCRREQKKKDQVEENMERTVQVG
jgi:hypothetical protein